jgi:thiamine pyrophosphate-dependent acetolactate synthase large subunit-like protein
MAELNGGRIIARQLQAAGIDTIFGVVAAPVIEIFSGAAAEGIKVVSCRHEVSAGFMASAWGYLNKKAGVVVVGSGPCLTNTITPMYVATESGMPLVVLSGSCHGMMVGLGGFQEADQLAFARPACKWARQVDSVERLPEFVHLALGKAVTGRPGAVYLDVPAQHIMSTLDEKKVALRNKQPECLKPSADAEGISRVAEMLTTAERPLVVLGKGAAWSDASDALLQLVNHGIPYITSPMARGIIPDDHPNFVNAARSLAFKKADCILMVGARFNWMFQLGKGMDRHVRIAQIDVCEEELYSGAELELGLVADASIAVAQLCKALEHSELRCAGGDWLAGLVRRRDHSASKSAANIVSNHVPIDPHRVLRELRELLPRNAVISVDAEVTMGIARQIVPSFEPRLRLNAGTTGCMGTGVPYSIGAKLARPDQPSVAILGDYAFGAAAMEIETAVRVGAAVVLLVINNDGIAGHSIQNAYFSPDTPAISSLHPGTRYEKMAEMLGVHSEYVAYPDEIRPALERALACNKVALVHVKADPDMTAAGGGLYLR